ncbi:hypothetical protein D9758_006476 [Tetrapyrgos nigripes]|uniref:Uncharacterized protein n=1 Tax=Tetrapyrgos nigripes TaxID=182062 RepID=A0A8H5GKL7_9AGAR|nr:hypothetical protein D9758_006476 [Tetrapyrgos nigripes]
MAQPIQAAVPTSDTAAPSAKKKFRRKVKRETTESIDTTQLLLRNYSKFAISFPELQESQKNFQARFDFLNSQLSEQMLQPGPDLLPKEKIRKAFFFWRSESEDPRVVNLRNEMLELRGRLSFASADVESKYHSRAQTVLEGFREELDQVLLQKYDPQITFLEFIGREVRPTAKLVFNAEEEEIYMMHICHKLQALENQKQPFNTAFEGVSPGLLILPATNSTPLGSQTQKHRGNMSTSSNPLPANQQLTDINADI